MLNLKLIPTNQMESLHSKTKIINQHKPLLPKIKKIILLFRILVLKIQGNRHSIRLKMDLINNSLLSNRNSLFLNNSSSLFNSNSLNLNKSHSQILNHSQTNKVNHINSQTNSSPHKVKIHITKSNLKHLQFNPISSVSLQIINKINLTPRQQIKIVL